MNYKCTLYKGEEEVLSSLFTTKKDIESTLVFDLLEYEILEERLDINGKTTIDIENETFTRENEGYLFLLDIKNKYCKIVLKKEDLAFEVNVEECAISVLNNKIVIDYFIETDETRNKIVIERVKENE